MFYVAIDTSVWLDLAQNPKLTPLLLVVENMVRKKMLTLIVPRVVVDEFRRNRERVSKTSARSLTGHFQQVKDAVKKAPTDAKRKTKLLKELDDLNHKLPLIGGAVDGVLERVDKLLAEATVTETTEGVKLCAAERALGRVAPCHVENKNSIADAIVLEVYLEAVKKGRAGDRFAFVTHNTTDFGLHGTNHKLPHPDLATHFSKIKSMYFVNLADALRKVDLSMVSELVWEQSYIEEPRGLSEILAAHEILWRQIWYGRHKHWAWEIERGRHKIVTNAEYDAGIKANGYKFHNKHTSESVWKMAQRAAKRTEKELGKDKIGPWDNFEWGMLNGKLSALRWVLGDEWDMLDT